MKLLHIIASMDPASGGPCQGIRNTNPELTHNGVSREVVSLDSPDSAFLGMDDFEIHALGPAKGPWQYSAKLRPWLVANMSRFDVVVINGLWLYSSYAGWSVKRELDKKAKKKGIFANVPKLYVMPHGMLDPYFQRAPDRKLKAIRNWFYWKLIESRVVNDADGLFFTCQVELELAREAFYPYHPKKEINVGYGIITPPAHQPEMDDAFFRKCPQVKGHPYLLFFSRIHKKKGVDLLIRAYADIVNKQIAERGEHYKLVVAGPGIDSSYGKMLERLIGHYPDLKGNLFFTGMLTGNVKWGALYNCDAFVLPSHQENFGIAVVEALACEKPVLVSHQVNIWKEIQHGGGGLVASDSIDGTRTLLNTWLNLPGHQKEEMGKKAALVFKDNFDIQRVAKHFIKAIFSQH
ncbi:glycosyltransferase [Mucilaginibacter pedocola]|uniref:Glycosyl transferase family 1 n=1 Tax=Mucilaginibacter pedocola TaxID=1792845 RepID=A0A1S9P7Z9_9SPHI|nr:glycosyltransferase [Mucilaginibacter pedocola]OOQ57076.1 glycosyl transferase family 1 [Mucilaginibacter pedocola]